MHSSASPTLAFFMSSGGSLGKWQREGILDREIRLLLEFVRRGVAKRILLFTYDARDAALLARLGATWPDAQRIEVLAPPQLLRRLGRIGATLFSILGPIYYRGRLSEAALLRTNQISGAWAAVLSKALSRRPLVLRFGYILSRRFEKNRQRLRARLTRRIESLCFAAADAIIVTSLDAQAAVTRRLGNSERVHLNPTFVDMSVFRPKVEYDFDAPVVFVGRLTAQKNLDSLVRAVAAIGLPLHLFGSGEDRDKLDILAKTLGCKTEFKGIVANAELAEKLREYTIFALPSYHEGLPKVLIEAMATGLICIGSTIPGVVDLVRDGENGYLIPGFDASAIERTLRRARDERRASLGSAARSTVESALGLDHHVETESRIHATLLNCNRPVRG